MNKFWALYYTTNELYYIWYTTCSTSKFQSSWRSSTIAPMRRQNWVSQRSNRNPFLGRWSPKFCSEYRRLLPRKWSFSHWEAWNHYHPWRQSKAQHCRPRPRFRKETKDNRKDQNQRFKPISDYCRTHQQPTIQLLGSDQLHPYAQPEHERGNRSTCSTHPQRNTSRMSTDSKMATSLLLSARPAVHLQWTSCRL